MAWDAVPPPPVLGAPLGVAACVEGVPVGHPLVAGDDEVAPHPVAPVEGEADGDVLAFGEAVSVDWLGSAEGESDGVSDGVSDVDWLASGDGEPASVDAESDGESDGPWTGHTESGSACALAAATPPPAPTAMTANDTIANRRSCTRRRRLS